MSVWIFTAATKQPEWRIDAQVCPGTKPETNVICFLQPEILPGSLTDIQFFKMVPPAGRFTPNLTPCLGACA
jgi:hypothetical protein